MPLFGPYDVQSFHAVEIVRERAGRMSIPWLAGVGDFAQSLALHFRGVLYAIYR